jgi:putative ABC transport system permease protein
MRAAWRLATSSLWQRRTRSLLLVLVIALSALLVSAVSVAMGSLRSALEGRVTAIVGNADARIQARGSGKTFDASLLREIERMDGVAVASPRLETALSLRFGKPVWKKPEGSLDDTHRLTVEVFQITARVTGIDPALDAKVRNVRLLSGRMPQTPDEIVLDQTLATRLSKENTSVGLGQIGLSLLARGSGEISRNNPGPVSVADAAEAARLNAQGSPRPDDWVELVRFGERARRLTVVGIAEPPPLGGAPWGYMTVAGVEKASKQSGVLTRIDVVLEKGSRVTPQQFVDTVSARLPEGALAQTSEKITSGFDKGARANELGFLLGNLMAFLAAGFIIMTGLSVGIVERQRELAMLRCIGASRWQLAMSQLMSGGVLGLIGSAIGVPLGVVAAVAMLTHYQDKLMAPPVVMWDRVLIAACGAIFAGLVGASLPAFQASRVTPLKALAARATPAKARTIGIVSACGLAGALIHLSIFTLLSNPDHIFYAYVTMGLPALMLGYFLLGVPVALIVAKVSAPLLERALSLPPKLLARSVRATPFRFGFTSGAMMAGLALMVAIWTQGGAAMRDWIDRIQFPDGFAAGLAMPPEAEVALRELPFITDTCAISLHPVETEAFGVRGLTRVKTFFVAFDPESFFRMSTITWIQGDEKSARARLEAGGAVIVAREFFIARKMGLGSEFVCWDDAGKEHRFEVVGVVSSPGLEVANNFFDVSEDFATEQRVHAVFGSRRDLKDKFGADSIGLIQFSMTASDDKDDEAAMRQIREKLQPFGLLNAGSGRQIKNTIMGFMDTTLKITSAIGVFAMLVACFGVANLVIAGVHARRYEFGVLRALGALPNTLTRLILAEAIIIALAACILGTVMGLQGAFGGITLNAHIWGIDLRLKPPVLAIAIGWAFVLVMCVGAAVPTAVSLGRQRARELLAAR